MYQKTQQALQNLQKVMQQQGLWQSQAPDEQAFLSEQPFALDTMTPTEWLQWIFIPRMFALIDAKVALPTQISISPYLEEALKEEVYLHELLMAMKAIEGLLQEK